MISDPLFARGQETGANWVIMARERRFLFASVWEYMIGAHGQVQLRFASRMQTRREP